MSYVNPIWLEGQRRRWQRHDWQRFVRPDGSEYKSYATRLIAQRQAEEEEARIAAEQEEMRETLSWLRRELAEVKFALAMLRIAHKYDPDQPRAPKGNPDGGQWTKDGGGDAGKDDGGDTIGDRPIKLAQSDFGKLIADFKVPGGRRCVYNFGVFSVVVPGPVNFSCPRSAHWSGVVHGRLLNDN